MLWMMQVGPTPLERSHWNTTLNNTYTQVRAYVNVGRWLRTQKLGVHVLPIFIDLKNRVGRSSHRKIAKRNHLETNENNWMQPSHAVDHSSVSIERTEQLNNTEPLVKNDARFSMQYKNMNEEHSLTTMQVGNIYAKTHKVLSCLGSSFNSQTTW